MAQVDLCSVCFLRLIPQNLALLNTIWYQSLTPKYIEIEKFTAVIVNVLCLYGIGPCPFNDHSSLSSTTVVQYEFHIYIFTLSLLSDTSLGGAVLGLGYSSFASIMGSSRRIEGLPGAGERRSCARCRSS